MKKNIVWMSLAAALVCSGAANAADGTINFTGSITTAACTIDTDSSSQVVNLGTVNATAFKGASGVAAAPTRFTIKLTACPAELTKASVKFDGVADSLNSSLLALSAGEDATGVALGIFESNGSTPIALQTASAPITFTSGAATVDYVAKYVSTDATVTAGSANAVTNFTIAYN